MRRRRGTLAAAARAFRAPGRVRGFLRTLADVRVSPRYRGLRWLSAVILLLFGLQLVTGLLLSLYYYPEPGVAHTSIRFLVADVSSGWFVRGLHHWSGEVLVIVLVAHLLHAWLRRAYARPREYVWATGVALLLVALAFRFTGRLLPWDDFGYEATRRGLALLQTIPLFGPLLVGWLRAGEDLGPNTLSRFFSTHVLLLPWVALVLGWLHLFLVRRHGLSGVPEDDA